MKPLKPIAWRSRNLRPTLTKVRVMLEDFRLPSISRSNAVTVGYLIEKGLISSPKIPWREPMNNRIKALQWVRSVTATNNIDWMLDGAKAVSAFLDESAKLGATEEMQDAALLCASASLVCSSASLSDVEPAWPPTIAAAHKALTWILEDSSKPGYLPGAVQ